jgi:hypothetical protein
MDGRQFDEITQELAEAPSRRRLLTGLAGGAALLTGALALGDAEAKKGKSKGKGKGKNKGGNGKGKKHGHNKVAICHKNDDGTFSLKQVPSPALKGHRKHGDVVCGDSELGVCQTAEATGCDEVTGACTFATAEDGTACSTVEVPEGVCLAGECVVDETPDE